MIVSSSRRVGVASPSSVAAGIERSLTAGSTLLVHASCTCSRVIACASSPLGAGGLSSGAGPAAGAGTGEGPHDSAAGTPACTRDSSTSTRWTSDSRARSDCGRVTFTSASSSGSRGSPPWRSSSTTTARRSISRNTVGSGSWFACSRSRSRDSSVSGSDSGTWPRCCTSSRCRRCSRSSRVSWPRSWPRSDSSSTSTSAPATSRSTIVSHSRKSASSSTAVPSWSTSCTEIWLPRRGRELVECRDRVAERPACPARDQRERRVGGVDALPVADAAEHRDDLLEARPLEDERLAARSHGRDDLRELRRAEDEDEVRRRLLDQLEQGVPGGRRELVRLVDDVDLVAALRGLQHRPLADLAHLVDAPLRRRVHLHDVERRSVGDRACDAGRRVEVRGRAALRVQRLGEDARHRRLARPTRAGEEIRLAHLVVLDRVPQRPHDGLLADDLREVERPVGAVERRHHGIVADLASASAGINARSRAPSSCGRPRVVSPPPARVGRCRGTWEGVLSAASFRI